jgi:hypothetical protein
MLKEMSENASAQRNEEQKREDQRAAKSASHRTSKVGHGNKENNQGKKRGAPGKGGKSKKVSKMSVTSEKEGETMGAVAHINVAVTPLVRGDTVTPTAVVPVTTTLPSDQGLRTKECNHGGSPVIPKPRKKSQTYQQTNVSEAVARLSQRPGYRNGKEGVEGIGCEHFSMEQMRQYTIHNKSLRDYYMQKGQFLDDTVCQVCARPAHKIDMKKEKDQITGAFIYYCDMGVKEKSDKYCCWYCKPCFEKEASKEMEAIKVINGGCSRRRNCRVPSVCV